MDDLYIDVIAVEQHIKAHRDAAAAEVYKGDFLQGFSLREASGRGEDEVIEALEELIQRGLLPEVDSGQLSHYSFYHE